jgi:hypothetical protein
MRQTHFPIPIQHIGLVEELDASQMALQRRRDDLWQHRHPILCALAMAYSDVIRGEIDIFDAQAQAFHKAQAGPVE